MRSELSIDTREEAMAALLAAWPRLVAECRQVQAGELHYQAMVYHALRSIGVPVTQLGMNVKQMITEVVSARAMRLAIEVKASERANSRLSAREISGDLQKLAAHREEVVHRGSDFMPVMMIVDVAALETERMTTSDLAKCRELARRLGVALLHVSQTADYADIPTENPGH